MYIDANFDKFYADFEKVRKDNFSYEGLKTLYNYLIEEENSGIGAVLDVISLCCSFTEYEDFEEIQEVYDVESIEGLQLRTIVLPMRYGGYIVANC